MKKIALITMVTVICWPTLFLQAITTIHHDKPESVTISKLTTKLSPNSTATTNSSERQKRLLPYINHYGNQRQKFTPFLESNALAGPFVPMVKSNPHEHYYRPSFSPNFGNIYDKLVHLKFVQSTNQYNKFKTVIDTYTPTDIDIPTNVYKIYKPQFIVNVPQHQQPSKYQIVRKPIYLTYSQEIDHDRGGNPIVFPNVRNRKPQVAAIVDDSYVAQKFTPPPEYHRYNHQNIEQYETASPLVTTDTSNSLGDILKHLQDSNALPRTLTPDNIDNSIKTLVRILNELKNSQKFAKPIVYQEEQQLKDEEIDVGTTTQIFPANTIDGGTPGRPGIDYPALSTIPPTTFDCKTQRYKGFFGDPHTNCQVWHYCDLNGGQASFLCPNGTIFSQVALTCDWWYNVKCSSTAQLYVLNERLYKYILPLAPKFPEDYSGPLVDKYLTLKFKEMEEKMRKENKDKPKKEEKDDSDQLQDIQNGKLLETIT